MKNLLNLIKNIKSGYGVESVILIGEFKDVKVPYGELSEYNIRQKNFQLTKKLEKRIKWSFDNFKIYTENDNLYVVLPGVKILNVMRNHTFAETSTGIYHVEGHTWIAKCDLKDYIEANKLRYL